ncbi:O-antigen ligase family protein [Hoeflea sp.]|uniref:O-antigen ligase family protein n=1 Tax=Hoeflea sp. TaxID=1940281 RepID=UPI003A940AFA
MRFPLPSKSASKRIFLFRRKLDGWLFALGAFMFMLPTETSAVVFGIFVVMGIYLLLFRPAKSLRHLDRKYVLATLAFSASCLAINLANGSLPEDMRWSSYPLYYLLIIPLAVGAVLVRDPLRQFVLGTRAGLVVMAIWGLTVTVMDGGRFGFGSNAANASFAIAFLAVVSRLQVKSPPWLLANRRLFFYVALIPILISQTRSVLPVFIVGLVWDLFSLARADMKSWKLADRQARAVWVAVLALAAGSIWLVSPILTQRIEATIKEVNVTLEFSEFTGSSGISTRLVQWQAALNLIPEHPLLGRGGHGISAEIAKRSPSYNQENLEKYSFVHNFILDEILQRGFVGLTLTLAYFGFCFYRIYARGSPSMQENVVLMLALTLSFGMLHYLLVIDRHVALYALYFLLLTTANHGWRPPYRQTA